MKFLDCNYRYHQFDDIGHSYIYYDLVAKAIWYGKGRNNWKSMFFKDGSITTILYRVMSWCVQKKIPFISILVSRLLTFFSSAVIGRKAQFGAGLIIVHSVGIVINSGVIGGSNIVIQHGVTIGAEKGKSPVLGNNIVIGAGAKIFGGIAIGNDVRVGANSVINFDVPDGATVVGVLGKIVAKRNVEGENEA